ncbi:MAG: prolyl oligopeptidase family serine peptidase [Bacteroidaceae bacterium]|nr:prolyl oligopeptidase family serine peptidase [Bacteroidaceae bacterium]
MKHILFSLFSLIVLTAQAEERRVPSLRIAQPVSIKVPLMTDTLDIMGKQWDENSRIASAYVNQQAWRQAPATTDSVLAAPQHAAVRMAGFTLENRNFAKTKIRTEGPQCKIFIDGQESAEKGLTPGRHEVALRITQQAQKADTLRVFVDAPADVAINPAGKAPFQLETLLYGEHLRGAKISADGRFLAIDKAITHTDAKTDQIKIIRELQTGSQFQVEGFMQWTSAGHRYITQRTLADMSQEYSAVDALTGKREVLFVKHNADNGHFLPGEQKMLVTLTTEGPRDDAQVHQILQPDDRQPGWRNRTNVGLLDVATGELQQITCGPHNTYATASPDGKQLLITIAKNDITRRPFSFNTCILLDVESMKADTLIANDGFISGGQFAPDGKSIVFEGSPECLGGIGNRVPAGMTPSLIEKELYLFDLTTRQFTPLTADFDPNILSWQWCKADGNIYALTENRDCQDIFRIHPRSGKIEQLNLSERFVYRFDLAKEKAVLTYFGEGHSNCERLYVVDLKSGKERLIEDMDAQRMKDIELGEFGEWNFQAERGDTIYGRYYLPPHFDPSLQYPMLVYYYGGCSPTGRYLDSYYCYHHWAAMGYVVYVIQPSGTTGFGQEFSARHVNAYGDYTADDIIQGTQQFCREHSFVNPKKIGCLGASYGGFMTMYLQTQTDIFAAAMSHAGISDPSSYWGYGYWGYSYSAVSAADSYPWSNPQLFNEHAPLQLADRVHTPILFMHGAADTNVPINESIQMFTALKILGRETAFVTVEGENHHILDYAKRIRWQNTIYAWFQRWLKDDASWWNELYPAKNLQ